MNCETVAQVFEYAQELAQKAFRQAVWFGKELPFSGNDFPALAWSNDCGSIRIGPNRPDRISAN